MTTTPELDPDTIRLIDDTIDATTEQADSNRVFVTTDRTAPAILAALLEAGWKPPTPTTPDTTTGVPIEFVIEERHDTRWVRARTVRVEQDEQHRQPWRPAPTIDRIERDARALLDWYRTLHPHTTFRLVREDITRTRTVIDP